MSMNSPEAANRRPQATTMAMAKLMFTLAAEAALAGDPTRPSAC